MHKIAYNPGRIVWTMLGSLLMSALCLWVFWVSGLKLILFGGAMFAICGAIAMYGLLMDRPALAFDGQQVTISTLASSKTLPWTQVRNIRVETITLSAYGVIPVGKQDRLVFDIDGGLFGSKTLGVSAKLLQAPQGLGPILAALSAAWHGTGPAPVPRRGAGSATSAADTDDGPSIPGFDPDAAIARYLARKAAEEAQQQAVPAVPPRPQFGRRGLG